MAGTSYTRQSTIADGNLISASLFNNEYNQLVNAFAYASSGTTGHTHDGSAGQGGNISKMGDQDFLNKIEVDSTNNRIGLYVEVSSAAVEQIRIQDGAIVPVTDSDIDLGTSSLEFKDLYIDGTANIDSLVLASGSTVTAILDEDNFSSDSATALATQQSIKAYVDAQVTAQDLDFQGDSGGALNIDLDSETLTIAGGTGIDTSGASNTLTVAIDSTVATLTGTQTLTNKTLTSPDINTPDIDGGTIDGTVIGGTTPAAVSATTVSATGNITVGGTVDGRDVATDGTKLDGIETGATADQTAAEIRTLVDSATDSNVFTDADHTKLDGIEASATADQTAAEIRTLVDSATDSNVFTDADHTKLDGIEASADVTDTTNVTAAGALMDSELTSEASVKAINQGLATTDSPTFTNMTLSGTDSIKVPSGTTAQRNGTPVNGMLRYNSTTAEFEGYQNSAWGSLGGGGDVVEDTTPQLGGNLDLNSNDITGTGNINITGNITLSGTVDGRDVATDGTKLDGIEASADVTDTANVTAAGALMDSELTSEASVKALNQGVATTDSPSFAGLTVDTDTLSVDATNNRVGIGTTTPSYPLEINHTGANTTALTLNDKNTVSNATGLYLRSTSEGRISVGSGAALTFAKNGGSDETMRIDSSGRLLLNKTNNDGSLIFQAQAPSGFSIGSGFYSGTTQSTIEFHDANTTADYKVRIGSETDDMVMFAGGSERMRIDSSGNIGIGDSTPQAKLDVNGAVLLQGGTFTAGIDSGTAGIVLQQDKAIFSRDVNNNYLRNLLTHKSDGVIDIGATGTSLISGVDIKAGTSGDIDLYPGNNRHINLNPTSNGAKVELGTNTDINSTSSYGLQYNDSSQMTINSGYVQINTELWPHPTNGIRWFQMTGPDMVIKQTASTGNNNIDILVGNTTTTTEFRFTHGGNFHADGTVTANSGTINSDERLKDNITVISNPFNIIDNIRGVTWNWKEDGTAGCGLVAQEVEQVLPSAVEDILPLSEPLGSTNTRKTLNYNQLIGVLVESVKELKTELNAAKARITELENA